MVGTEKYIYCMDLDTCILQKIFIVNIYTVDTEGLQGLVYRRLCNRFQVGLFNTVTSSAFARHPPGSEHFLKSW